MIITKTFILKIWRPCNLKREQSITFRLKYGFYGRSSSRHSNLWQRMECPGW